MYLLSDYQLQVQELVHDTGGIDFTTAELTNWINNARKRVALDFHNVRYLFQNAALVAGQEQYPITGGVVGLTITNPGVNYTAPVATVSAPGGTGVRATANLVSAGGMITQVNMTNWGSGYAATPTVTVTDGAGAGAVLTPMTAFNIFDIGGVTVLWGFQRYTLGWLPWAPFQAFCRSNPTLQRQPAVWTTFQEQNLLFFYPTPDQAYLMDLEGIGLPQPLVAAADIDSQILDPVADNVQYWAAHLALLKMQNFEQASYYEKKYEKRALQLQATRQTRRVGNIYRNYFRRINRM